MAAIFPPAWKSGALALFEAGDEDNDRQRPDQPDQALRFRRLQLEDERKQIPVDGLLRAKEQMDAMRTEQARKAAESGKPEGLEVARLIPSDWQWIGPGNVGGRIRSIVIHPTVPTRMWVGSVSGGIWYSSNAGAAWAPVNDFLANLAVSTMVIDPVNPSIMYAGTGEGFSNVDALQGNGIFKSTDSGVTWNLLASTNPAIDPPPPGCGMGAAPCPSFWFYLNRLAISPDGITLLAASSVGLARSTDGGATWVQQGVQSTMDLDFRPNDSTQAVVGQLGRAFYTTNSGQTWTLATFNPAITTSAMVQTNGRVELAYAGNGTPQIVYAAVNNNNGDIYRSIDGGQSFTRVKTGMNYFLAGGNSQGWYANAIWVNPQDATSVVIGGTDLWRSTDSGATFTQISEWGCAPLTGNACQGTSVHADHHVIISAPGFNNTTNKTVYFGNDGGLSRTDDVLAAATRSGWINLNNNLGITQLYSGGAGPTGRVIGGAQDNGNVINAPLPSPSPNAYNTQAWVTPTGASGDGGFVAVDPTDANYLYTEYIYLEIRRSSNGGNSVTNINAGITDSTISCNPPPAGGCANFVAPFILDPNNADRMLAGGTSLWRSDNVKTATPTWTSIKPPYSFNIPPSNQPISAIAVAEGNSDFIVVGHNDGSIFLTSDGTAAAPMWTKIDTAAVPSRFLTRLVVDATRSPSWIYATFGGFSPDNVYVTKDLGATWIDLTGSGTTGLPDIPVRSLTINPVRPDYLYVGTELGIFASEDAGATWQLPQGGPANVSVDELFWSNGVLSAATYGRGFYTTKTPVFSQPASCNPPPTCPNDTCTPGWWDCSCTWNNHRIPGPTDDVSVTCPILVRSGSVSPQNLRVNGHLTFASNAALMMPSGSLLNFGTIDGGYELRAGSLVNGGTISTGRVWVLGDLVSSGTGQIANNGTIQSSASWGSSDTQYPIQANNITLGEHGSLIAQGVLCSGNLVIGPGASFHALSATSLTPAKRALFLNGNATNLGFLDVRGEMALLPESQTFSGNHTFSGTGQWELGALAIGDRFNPNSGGRVNILLGSDLTLKVAGLTGYGNSSLVLTSDSNVLLSGHNLWINSPSLLSYGQWNVGAGALNLNIPYIKTQRIIPGRNDGLSGFTGSGSVNLTALGATHLDLDTLIFTPAFHLATGTVDGTMGTTFKNAFTVDAGATLNVNQGALKIEGDLLVNGSIGKTSASGGGGLFFFGSTVTNNGSIAGNFVNFNYDPNAVPKTQTITGPGSWSAATAIRIGWPDTAPTTVALANDMTLNWNNLAIWSDSKITTGAFTLTMPCGSAFDTSSTLYSGEIIGNVRRTNIGSCNGTAVPFTSRYTTVRFDSGTPPSEMTISNKLLAPSGFPSAVLRNYQITPVGGSGYSATLRLDYSPAETNGNPASNLSLWRNNGTNWISQGATARDLSAHWVELSGVTQFSPWALASCALSISPGSTSVASGGGMGSFQVTSTGTCGWTATSNAPWITVTSGASVSGNGAVGFTADANTGAQRSGTITVAGVAGTTQTFSVSQAADCSGLTLNPTSANVAASGASGSVAVTASGCAWAATSNAPWITITSGASGSGNGTVGYNVQANSGPVRSGTISISGKTFTVTQASGCQYSFAVNQQSVAAAGGSYSTQINTSATCQWDVVSNAGWITITPPTSGTGPGTLSYSVDANPGPPRVGTFSMGNQTFTVSQGSSTPISLIVTNTNDSGAGSFRQVILDANANFGQTNTISFNLTGGVTIAPQSALPSISNPVVINGINQDGRRVVLTGGGGGGGGVDGGGAFYGGLVITGEGTTIRGLTIVRFSFGSAIKLSSNGNTIENCYLGTDSTGAPGLANGLAMEIYSSNNRIGGNAPGTGNTIAFNGFAGVVVVTGVNNSIRGNSIFSNGGLGIDLGGDGVTPNGSPGAGPNNLQRYPVLSTLPGADKIDGTLDAAPSSPFTIELFANDACNPSGNGEGRTLFAMIDVVTDASGHASFTYALPSFVTTGNSITATTTNATGNTSEFSSCVAVTPLKIGSITRLGTGGMQLNGIGVPNQQHTVEILSNLSGNGVPITVNVMADAEGRWQYTDSQSGLSGTRFYRLRFP